MNNNGVRRLLIAGAAVVILLAGAYGTGMMDNFLQKNPEIAALIQPPSSAVPPPAAPSESQVPLPQEKAADAQPQPEAESGIVIPTFDVVRVEANGSVVVAGRAASGAIVELITGSTTLGAANATPEGAFAVVLDDPLKPGDYTVVLRATSPGDVVVMSKETAIISIPENESGQVLALVEEPGVPSRIVTVPEPAPAGGSVAAPSPEAAPQQPAPGVPAVAGPVITVDAVEIEGRNVFVAGHADAGKQVRVYANAYLLGQTRASESGRFLVETRRDLAVGDYIVRADLLAPDGVTVIARAAVPFTREPGEQISAVAPQPDAVSPPAQSGEGDAAVATPGPSAPVEAGPEQAAGAPAEGGAEITAPRLEPATGSVIIRRGDTLWRISRRVYGRGVRYSTIYLANQQQISDPDKIWPGQVFAVPDKTDEGEPADMTAISEQTAPATAN